MNYIKYTELLEKCTAELLCREYKKDSISRYLIICILPSGKCIFISKPNDIYIESKEQNHLNSLIKALDEILKIYKINIKDYVECCLTTMSDEIVAGDIVYSILNDLGVSMLYYIGKDADETAYIVFEKSKGFTEKQKTTVRIMNKMLEFEKFKVAAIEYVGNDIFDCVGCIPEYRTNLGADGLSYIGYNIRSNAFFSRDEVSKETLTLKEFYEIIEQIKPSINDESKIIDELKFRGISTVTNDCTTYRTYSDSDGPDL